MEIELRHAGTATIVVLSGRLDSTNATEADSTIQNCGNDQTNRLVLDLSTVNYVSSAGLRVVLLAAKRTSAKGGRFAIAGLQQNVREVFDVSGFLQILTVFDTADEAVAYVQG